MGAATAAAEVAPLPRRRVLQAMAGASVAGASVAIVPAPRAADVAWPAPGDVLVHDAGPKPGEPLRASALATGAPPVHAVARGADGSLKNHSRLQRVLVLRLDPEGLDPRTRAAAAGGVVGYALVCPHQGCDVTGWNAERAELSCPCHFSRFSPAKGGTVIDGPAPRRLSQLPLRLEGDTLVVAAPFTKKPGFRKPSS
jgi:Rieske Fe-S protein